MKVIYNNIIPFRGFAAINICGVLFVRRGERLTTTMLRHELIHTAQMRRLLYVGFYVAYLAEWIVNIVRYGFGKRAYFNISFEREAYEHQRDVRYLAEKSATNDSKS